MGNVMKRYSGGGAQVAPQQGAVYSTYPQQPMVQPQPGVVAQPVVQQQTPAYVQQPQYAVQQTPGVQYRPATYQPVAQTTPVYQPVQPPVSVYQPGYQAAPVYPQPPPTAPLYPPTQPAPQIAPSYRPTYPNAPYSPSYSPGSPFSLPFNAYQSSYENNAFLANLTGWSVQDIERLRQEFVSYANPYGVIDREGFRKLYVASLLNMNWDAVERDAESAFRSFDINQTGVLDFNEYITACSRMSREVNPGYPPPPAFSQPPPAFSQPPPLAPSPLGPMMNPPYAY